jgi:hypothetical protein
MYPENGSKFFPRNMFEILFFAVVFGIIITWKEFILSICAAVLMGSRSGIHPCATYGVSTYTDAGGLCDVCFILERRIEGVMRKQDGGVVGEP